MRYIELTIYGEINKKVIINVSQIVCITDCKNWRRIQLLNEVFSVHETMQQIKKILELINN